MTAGCRVPHFCPHLAEVGKHSSLPAAPYPRTIPGAPPLSRFLRQGGKARLPPSRPASAHNPGCPTLVALFATGWESTAPSPPPCIRAQSRVPHPCRAFCDRVGKHSSLPAALHPRTIPGAPPWSRFLRQGGKARLHPSRPASAHNPGCPTLVCGFIRSEERRVGKECAL